MDVEQVDSSIDQHRSDVQQSEKKYLSFRPSISILVGRSQTDLAGQCGKLLLSKYSYSPLNHYHLDIDLLLLLLVCRYRCPILLLGQERGAFKDEASLSYLHLLYKDALGFSILSISQLESIQAGRVSQRLRISLAVFLLESKPFQTTILIHPFVFLFALVQFPYSIDCFQNVFADVVLRQVFVSIDSATSVRKVKSSFCSMYPGLVMNCTMSH